MDTIDRDARPYTTDLPSLLAEQAWLRRLARSLVGESDADDLTQDVVAIALQRQPEVREGLRPWLVRVAQRLALQGRRRDARRQRREHAAASGGAAPSAADVVERTQMHSLVLGATLQLAEPYRTTLLLRFYDGMSIHEVARRGGVPLETARTRLRRALATVRARLDQACGDRAAWVLPLSVLAREPAPLVATIAAGVLMTTQGKVLIGGLAVLMFALLVWSTAPASVLEAPAVPPARPELQAASLDRQPEAAMSAETPMPAVHSPDRVAVLPANGVRILGRAVAAEQRLPLGGCRVDLFLSQADVETTGTREPDASVTTAADGRFCVECALPAPSQLSLYLRAEGRGCVSRQWRRVERGDLDCGDVPLALGAVLVGRALDEHGVPVRGVHVVWHLQEPLQDGWRQQSVSVSSDVGGALQGKVLAPGTWHLECISQHQLLQPNSVDVAPGATTVPIDVVVRRPEELPSISGIVVDAVGAPVRNLQLFGHRSTGPDLRCITAADGSFGFVRKEGADEPVQLRVYGGHRLPDDDTKYEWGTHDVQVVVLGPVEARLVVVDAAGAPVTRFTARLQSIADGNRSSRLSSATVRAHLQDDALVLRDLPSDRYRVAVLPDDPARGNCAPVDWDLHDGAVLRLSLEAPAPLRVLLRLSSGTPVADSRVQLLRSESGADLRLDCQTLQLRESFANRWPGAGDGVIVDEAVTDVDGAVVLRGVPGETFTVRALGPGHAPLLQAGVVLVPNGSDLVLQVARGAAVRGRVSPRATLDLLQPQPQTIRAFVGPDADLEAWMTARAPTLRLVEAGGARRRLPLETILGLRIHPDGSFGFEDVPAGDWLLSLEYWRDIAQRGGSLKHLELANLRDLRDGEVRRLDLDIAATQPGRIRGLVLFEGQPWRNGRARLGDSEVRTDGDGHFEAEFDSGRYWLELLSAGDAGRVAAAAQPVEVVPGITMEHTFDLCRRALVLRVLEADGTPANQRLILLRGGMQSDAPERDTDGWITIDPAPPRPVEVLTYPQGFDAATRAATPPQQRQGLVIRLGPVGVDADRRVTRAELRIPPGK